jgi:rhodanese-related sulfurtransferase
MSSPNSEVMSSHDQIQDRDPHPNASGAGPQSPASSFGAPQEPVRTIETDELRRKLARGDDFKLVMTLNEWGFRAKHIAGSLHFNSPEDLLAHLGKDEEIVVYCSNVDCHASVAAYRSLLAHGYSRVRRYAGGLIAWEAAGLPLEGDWVTAPQA